MGLYLGNSAVASSFGAAGSLVLLLLWIFCSAQILVFGAEFTQVFVHRDCDNNFWSQEKVIYSLNNSPAATSSAIVSLSAPSPQNLRHQSILGNAQLSNPDQPPGSLSHLRQKMEKRANQLID